MRQVFSWALPTRILENKKHVIFPSSGNYIGFLKIFHMANDHYQTCDLIGSKS
jgi:hypothetical protein